MSFRSLKTDIDPRKLIRRWKSMPRQQRTTVTESDVTYRDSTGRTLLYFAAKNGETERVKQLLKAGCNPRLSDINRNTALHMAADGGYIEIIHMLVEYGKYIWIVNLNQYNWNIGYCFNLIEFDRFNHFKINWNLNIGYCFKLIEFDHFKYLK